jgi:hypothetical protein
LYLTPKHGLGVSANHMSFHEYVLARTSMYCLCTEVKILVLSCTGTYRYGTSFTKNDMYLSEILVLSCTSAYRYGTSFTIKDRQSASGEGRNPPGFVLEQP